MTLLPRSGSATGKATLYPSFLAHCPALTCSLNHSRTLQLAAGRSAADLGELIRRIRVVHAAALNSENRKGLQLLYGILVQVGGPPVFLC